MCKFWYNLYDFITAMCDQCFEQLTVSGLSWSLAGCQSKVIITVTWVIMFLWLSYNESCKHYVNVLALFLFMLCSVCILNRKLWIVCEMYPGDFCTTLVTYYVYQGKLNWLNYLDFWLVTKIRQISKRFFLTLRMYCTWNALKLLMKYFF